MNVKRENPLPVVILVGGPVPGLWGAPRTPGEAADTGHPEGLQYGPAVSRGPTGTGGIAWPVPKRHSRHKGRTDHIGF